MLSWHRATMMIKRTSWAWMPWENPYSTQSKDDDLQKLHSEKNEFCIISNSAKTAFDAQKKICLENLLGKSTSDCHRTNCPHLNSKKKKVGDGCSRQILLWRCPTTTISMNQHLTADKLIVVSSLIPKKLEFYALKRIIHENAHRWWPREINIWLPQNILFSSGKIPKRDWRWMLSANPLAATPSDNNLHESTFDCFKTFPLTLWICVSNWILHHW